MDLSGYSFMDQDQDVVVMGDTAPVDYDHVKWQGSQTANQALNQLIRTSVNEPVLAKSKENVNVNGEASRSWQREPSFDQIPGFSLLSTKDSGSADGSSSLSSSLHRTPQSTMTSSGKSLSSSRLSHPRSRTSLALTASTPNEKSSSSSITLPFFDKTNPSQFLDILKGVSARVDANAGVRPRNSTGGMDPLPSSRIFKGRKRPRGVSLGSSSETVVDRFKRGRTEALRESGGVNPKAKDRDKGKGRVIPGTDEGSTVGAASASPNAGGDCSRPSLPQKPNVSRVDMDCGNPEGDQSTLGLSDQVKNYHSSSSNSSQTKMPPPPPPGPRSKPTNSRVLPVASSPTSAPSSTSGSTSITLLPPTSRGIYNRHEFLVNDTKPQSTSQTPKYHPLLLEPQPKPLLKIQNPPPHGQSVVAHPKVKSEIRQGAPVPAPAQKAQPSVVAAAPSPSLAPLPTSTPQFSSSQSSRPPPLGMRRTHTFPSSSSLSSAGIVPSLQKTGVLPTKQKGFKPPLLSASQPQPASQAPAVSRGAKGTPSIVRGQQPMQPLAGTKSPVPASSNGYTSSSSNSPHSAGVGGPPTSSLSRSTSNSPASSSITVGTSKIAGSRGPSLHSRAKPTLATATNCNPAGAAQYTNDLGRPANAPPSAHAVARQVKPQFQPRQRLDSRVPVSVPVSAATPAIPTKPPPCPARVASPPLPEPADGDPDSSFGDMSFDMDALEETMRQYD